MATIFTVGHGTRSLDEFLSVLREASVEALADVRRFPGSRRYPHFGHQAMERALGEAGVGYRWWGEALGGRRSGIAQSRHSAIRNKSFRAYADHMDGAEFLVALEELKSVANTAPLAIMCSETLWWRCHRRHLADVLMMDRFEVVHLIDERSSQTHTLHPALRTEPDGRPVYDVSERGRLIE